MLVNAEKNYKTAISDFGNFKILKILRFFFNIAFYVFKKTPQISKFSKKEYMH